MSKLLKKLKPGVRVIDIELGIEGYVSYNKDIVPNNITVEFEPSLVCSNKDIKVAAISYPIYDIENRIKLAPKYGNYKVGDRVKDLTLNMKGIIIDWVHGSQPIVVLLESGLRQRYCSNGKKYSTDIQPRIKRLKVKR